MFFALADYVAYRRQWGRYSPSDLTRNGWTLTVPEKCLGANQPRKGAIVIFHQRPSFVSWVVMYVTNSVASHTAIAVGRDHIVDATTSGVLLHPLVDYLNGRSWAMWGVPSEATDAQLEAVAESALDIVGKVKYGYATAAIIGWLRITGGDIWHTPGLRLQADVLTCLSAPFLLLRLKFGRKAGGALLLPMIYIAILARNLMRRTQRLRHSTSK